MPQSKPITVIGGGLAGLALGIGLRQQDVPVTLYEAGHYPRHRVCGEFINGRGRASLARLGLEALGERANSVSAETAIFASGNVASPVRQLPKQALCVSRFVLDEMLAKRFRQFGGELRENERQQATTDQEGVVRSSGRRPYGPEKGWRWFGLKIHARNVRLDADLELHVVPNGYVGICRLPQDEVNICGLFRRSQNITENTPGRIDPLRGPNGSLIRKKLEEAEFDDDSFCSVAGLSLRPNRATEQRDCSIGDALTMTPPVTGNGMSMAFESAEIAVTPLVSYARGEMDWPMTQSQIASRCDEKFASRLKWAQALQWILFTPLADERLARFTFGSRFLWNIWFNNTR
jgi:flavin-dependent dehydrogenase